MSTRHIYYFLVFALLSASNIGCCGYMRGCGAGIGGQMYGSSCASCGCPEASCCCPEASCGCEDTCCEAGCGCSDCCEAVCGCSDYCEPACGCGDVGCGSGVSGRCPILGNCLIMRRLRKAWNNCYGCNSQGYWSEWHNDPPCNCQAGAGGHYGGAYGRRAFLAKQHQNISEELRLADEGSGPTFR